MNNLQREVWEGWTPRDFIDALSWEMDLIMSGGSWQKPFKTKVEMAEYIKEHQPYYKESVPEVNEYFAGRYGLE